MTLVTNSTAQTLKPGQSISFDSVLLKTGDSECCHNGNRIMPSVKLRHCGIYIISFSGNVAGATSDVAVQLNVEIDGVPLPETKMISVPATATTEFNNVSTATAVPNGNKDCATVTVTNTGTGNLIVSAGSSLLIRRT